MKQFGFTGKGTGKFGSSVFTINSGVQIVRQYNPVVANPNTALQTTQRGKFKLMSQVAAAVAPSIAIPREGLQSPRNLFVKQNFGAVSSNGDTASVDVKQLQMTSGSRSLHPLVVQFTYDSGNGVGNVHISVDAVGLPSDATKVAAFAYAVNDDGQLNLVSQRLHDVIIDSDGDATLGTDFDLAVPVGRVVVYTYALLDTTGAARSTYGDYNIATASDVASLISSRSLQSAGFDVTKSNAVIGTITAGA